LYTAAGRPAASFQNKKGAEAPFAYLARPERFELPTTKFVAWYSIQLSYGREEAELYSVCVQCLKPVMPESKNKEPKAASFRDAGGMLLGTSMCLALWAAFAAQIGNPADLSNPSGFVHASLSRKENGPEKGPFSFPGGEGGIRTLDRAFDPILP
jgi:hypothetical protein